MSKIRYLQRRWKNFERFPYIALFYKNPPKQKGWKSFQLPAKLSILKGLHSTQTWIWVSHEIDLEFFKNLPDSCLALKIEEKWYGPLKIPFINLQDVQIQWIKKLINPKLNLLHLLKKKHVVT